MTRNSQTCPLVAAQVRRSDIFRLFNFIIDQQWNTKAFACSYDKGAQRDAYLEEADISRSIIYDYEKLVLINLMFIYLVFVSFCHSLLFLIFFLLATPLNPLKRKNMWRKQRQNTGRDVSWKSQPVWTRTCLTQKGVHFIQPVIFITTIPDQT